MNYQTSNNLTLRDMLNEPMALETLADMLSAMASMARRLQTLRDAIDNAPDVDSAALAPLFLNMLDAARR